MQRGRDKSAWSIVSEMLAVMVNLWSGKRSQRFTGADFNPYAIEQGKAAKASVEIGILRRVFVEGKAL